MQKKIRTEALFNFISTDIYIYISFNKVVFKIFEKAEPQ